jgi:uncharacterized cupin superfamily protein
MIIKELKDQIIDVLKKNPDCRNSDITLTIEIWKNHYSKMIDGDTVKLKNLYELPREDNIKRIRAKLCEEALERINSGKIIGDEQYYLPTEAKIAKQRQINSALWEKALGYFKTPVPQSEQLPRPVGSISFTTVNPGHWIAFGTDNKEYHISYSTGYRWRCECEAFRYNNGKKCKHIKAIEQYLLNLQKQEAAKLQNNLF